MLSKKAELPPLGPSPRPRTSAPPPDELVMTPPANYTGSAPPPPNPRLPAGIPSTAVLEAEAQQYANNFVNEMSKPSTQQTEADRLYNLSYGPALKSPYHQILEQQSNVVQQPYYDPPSTQNYQRYSQEELERYQANQQRRLQAEYERQPYESQRRYERYGAQSGQPYEPYISQDLYQDPGHAPPLPSFQRGGGSIVHPQPQYPPNAYEPPKPDMYMAERQMYTHSSTLAPTAPLTPPPEDDLKSAQRSRAAPSERRKTRTCNSSATDRFPNKEDLVYPREAAEPFPRVYSVDPARIPLPRSTVPSIRPGAPSVDMVETVQTAKTARTVRSAVPQPRAQSTSAPSVQPSQTARGSRTAPLERRGQSRATQASSVAVPRGQPPSRVFVDRSTSQAASRSRPPTQPPALAYPERLAPSAHPSASSHQREQTNKIDRSASPIPSHRSYQAAAPPHHSPVPSLRPKLESHSPVASQRSAVRLSPAPSHRSAASHQSAVPPERAEAKAAQRTASVAPSQKHQRSHSAESQVNVDKPLPLGRQRPSSSSASDQRSVSQPGLPELHAHEHSTGGLSLDSRYPSIIPRGPSAGNSKEYDLLAPIDPGQLSYKPG